jgi:hypothetical protein
LRDAADLADLLRMGRLPEAWIGPPATRELRGWVRHRAKLVGLRSNIQCQVHAVLAGAGVTVSMSDLFGVSGHRLRRLPASHTSDLGLVLAPRERAATDPPIQPRSACRARVEWDRHVCAGEPGRVGAHPCSDLRRYDRAFVPAGCGGLFRPSTADIRYHCGGWRRRRPANEM